MEKEFMCISSDNKLKIYNIDANGKIDLSNIIEKSDH